MSVYSGDSGQQPTQMCSCAVFFFQNPRYTVFDSDALHQ